MRGETKRRIETFENVSYMTLLHICYTEYIQNGFVRQKHAI